jgi:hypothetical protein
MASLPGDGAGVDGSPVDGGGTGGDMIPTKPSFSASFSAFSFPTR